MIDQSEIDIYSMMAYNAVSPEYSKKVAGTHFITLNLILVLKH